MTRESMIGKTISGGSRLPSGPGLAPGCRSGSVGSPVRARVPMGGLADPGMRARA